MRKLEVVKEFRFEAAHVLPKHSGKCSRLHGHSWLMRVGISAPVNPETGFVIDFFDLKGLVQPLIDRWDHSYLGATDLGIGEQNGREIRASFDGYPSSENLVTYVVEFVQDNLRRGAMPGEIKGDVASLPQLTLVEIEETCTSRCTWRPNGTSR